MSFETNPYKPPKHESPEQGALIDELKRRVKDSFKSRDEMLLCAANELRDKLILVEEQNTALKTQMKEFQRWQDLTSNNISAYEMTFMRLNNEQVKLQERLQRKCNALIACQLSEQRLRDALIWIAQCPFEAGLKECQEAARVALGPCTLPDEFPEEPAP